MNLEFTFLEMLLIDFALKNTPKGVDQWELERNAEPKFRLSDEERAPWGIDYQGKTFTVTLPNQAAKPKEETWQTLGAPTVTRDLARPDVEVALLSVKGCEAWGYEERDYVFALMDKLTDYLTGFQARELLDRLPREAVIRAAEGILEGKA